MATATQIKAALYTTILARIENDGIEEYTLFDGRRVKKAGLSALLEARREFAAEARDEANGTSLTRFAFRRIPLQ